ncbi:MAG: hypothetical protein ABFS45_22025 [Pseudomonadota bacterium]
MVFSNIDMSRLTVPDIGIFTLVAILAGMTWKRKNQYSKHSKYFYNTLAG